MADMNSSTINGPARYLDVGLPHFDDALKDPPPEYTYDELSRPPSSILTGISSATLTVPDAHIKGNYFPTTFNGYFRRTYLQRTIFQLGEHFDQPLHAFLMSMGRKGSSLVLYSGPETTSVPLAIAVPVSLISRNSMITLDAGELCISTNATSSHSYTFTIETALGVEETFEWRLTRGNEVRDLDSSALGWKLVRLQSSSASPGGRREDREIGVTSDGKEVVAVWADVHPRKSKWARFKFYGAGATGELGVKWSIMAVVTVLRIWQNFGFGC